MKEQRSKPGIKRILSSSNSTLQRRSSAKRLKNSGGFAVEPLFPSLFGGVYTAVELASLFKLWCNIAMTVTLLIQSSAWMIAIIRCSEGDTFSDFASEDDSPSSNFRITLTVSGLCMGLSFFLKMTSFFEQLRTTFAGTKYRLPKWSPRIVYFLSGFGLIWVATVLLFSQITWVSLLTRVLFLIVYSGVTGSIVYCFVSKTVKVARSLGDQNSDQCDYRLMEVAIRISLCVLSGLFLTTLNLFVGIILTLACNSCWTAILLQNTVFAAEFGGSSFYLMCTFNGAQREYYITLGWLHRIVSMCLDVPPIPQDSHPSAVAVTRVGSATPMGSNHSHMTRQITIGSGSLHETELSLTNY